MVAPAVYAAPETGLPASVSEAFGTYIALPGKLVPHLQKAQDTESANAAAPGLRRALSAVYEAREQLHNMPRLTSRQNQIVRQVYSRRMREEWARMYAEISRLQQARCYQSADFAEVFHLLCMMIEK